MSRSNHVHEVGTVLILEHGRYSDFSYVGPFRVLKAIDRDVVSAQFVKNYKLEHPGDHRLYSPSTSAFTPWLQKNGYIDECPHEAWHIGDYKFGD